jgi:AcrR family transcriptional regulator
LAGVLGVGSGHRSDQERTESAVTPQPEEDTPRRTRDAARSKRALLKAGSEVFAAKGYSRARLRDIADIAGVDAALVIRYFDSKAGLYQAVLEQGEVDGLPVPQRLDANQLDGMIDELVDRAMSRWDTDGVGALALALSRPDAGAEIRAEVYRRMSTAVLDPLVDAARAAGVTDPRLRAEAAVAALVGMGTMWSLGTLAALGQADRAAVEPLMRQALRAILLP